MKTLIKNFIAVMAFMILGHFAVVAQVTTQDGTFYVTTTDGSDTTQFAVIVDAATGKFFVGFNGANPSFKSGTIKVRFNCSEEIVNIDYTDFGQYGEGTLIIQITENPQEIEKYLRDNADILSVTSSTGEVLKAELTNTAEVVYKVCDEICPQCEFTKPDCNYTKL